MRLLRPLYIFLVIYISVSAFFCANSIFAAEKETRVVRIRDVQGSVNAFLEAVAVNGNPISHGDPLHVDFGDTITFRVGIENSLSAIHYDVQSEVRWGTGFSFQGVRDCENAQCVDDERAGKISVNIPELHPKTGEEEFFYTFDLIVTGCEDLFINLYSDEIYTCDKLQSHHMAVQIKTPDIHFTTSPELIETTPGTWQTVTVEIENKGTGNATNFLLDTDFKNRRVQIRNVSKGFQFDSVTGAFRFDQPIEPGAHKTLTFDLNMEDMRRDVSLPVQIPFKASYTSNCGIHFTAPPMGPLFSESELEVFVTPECLRAATPDHTLQWDIYVINTGTEMIRNVRLKDTLGQNLRFDSSMVNDEEMPPALVDKTSPSGVTHLAWDLGDISPAGVQKVTITAYPADAPEDSAGFFNTIYLQYGDEDECCKYVDIQAPCFTLPGECYTEDVFEQCRRLRAFFSITQMYKSNLFRTADDPKGVWATYFTPGIWLSMPASCERVIEIVTTSATPGGLAVSPFYPKSSRKYQSYFLYSPQYEIYQDYSDENMTTHRMDAYFRYNTLNTFSFRLLDQYKTGHDSISSRNYTVDDRYRSNLFSALATYDPTSRLRFRMDYSNFMLTYDEDFNRQRADRMDNSIAAYVFFNLTSKMAIFANYEFTDIDYDFNDLDSLEKRLFGGIRWDITHKTGGLVKGGYGKRVFDQPEIKDASTWMAEVQVDHVFTPKTRIIVNAYRRYDEVMSERVEKNNLPAIFTKYILTHFVGVSLNYKLTSKLHLNLDGTLFYDAYKDEKRLTTRKERRDREYAISPSLKFDFSKWLAFDTAYIYTKRDSNYPRYDHEDHTIFLRASVIY